jgi:hypothetical protein
MLIQLDIVIAMFGFSLKVSPEMSKAPPFSSKPLPHVSLKLGVDAGAISLPTFVLLESSWMTSFRSSSNRK